MARKTSFYYAFLALPKAKRQAIVAVWDFCRAVDDGVDLAPTTEAGRRGDRRLARESSTVCSATTNRRRPRAVTCSRSSASFDLAREDFDALVDGVAMDASPRRYETFADLEPYCHRVASAVGLMCVRIFGYRNPVVRDYARDLGVALQLTNILRDVGVDFRRGRVYLPMEDLIAFRLHRRRHRARESSTPDAASAVSACVRCSSTTRRARVCFYARAVRALPADEGPSLVAAEIMREIYWELLRRIESRAVRCLQLGHPCASSGAGTYRAPYLVERPPPGRRPAQR